MPELPEVETLRRLLESTVVGRRVATARRSALSLRRPMPRGLERRLGARRIMAVRRAGKYLMLDFERDVTLLVHLGMTGRFLFFPQPPARRLPHVHARLTFEDGSQLWFQDARRFGLLRLYATADLERAAELRDLGLDPLGMRPESLYASARKSRVAIKLFLTDQRRVAGVGNIYASEILHRAGLHPAARACDLGTEDCAAIARELPRVLGEAIRNCGTTFSDYATLGGEPGGYSRYLRVYDRAGQPCRSCGAAIARITQGQRSTFYCPRCQAPHAGEESPHPGGPRLRRGPPDAAPPTPRPRAPERARRRRR